MKPRASSGFTLLEILVALVVFGFLLLGLSQTVRFGLTAWHRDARLSDTKTDLEAVDRTLRAVVENLAPGDDAARSSIDGLAESMTGVTRIRLPTSGLPALGLPASGLPTSGSGDARVEAALAVTGGRLVLRWRPDTHALPLRPRPPPAETELLGGVARLGIDYWRPPGVWVRQWHEPELPLLIRFRLTFAGPLQRRWPDIVVAPLLSRP